jgi:hypothetical protein
MNSPSSGIPYLSRERIKISSDLVEPAIMVSMHEALERLDDLLDGQEWCITGGVAVEAHIDGDRPIGDIDLLMRERTAHDLAERLDLVPDEDGDRGGFSGAEDVHLSFELAGQEIEIMAGDTEITVDGEVFEATMDDALFENAELLEVAGVAVPVVPPAEVLVQRVVLGREKDLNDIEMLLAATTIDEDVLADSLAARSLSRQRFDELLAERGFSL